MMTKWGKLFFVVIASMIFFPAFADAKHQAISIITTSDMIKLFVSLFSVIVLVLVFSFLFKKLNNLSVGQSPIKVLATQVVGSKEKLVIVEIENEQMLIGVSPGGINYIKEVKIDKKLQQKSMVTFSENLKSFMNKGEK